MADSAIQWTDKVWNCVIGCSRVSDGCTRCYAERLAPRLAAMGQVAYEGLTKKHADGSINWTGEVRCLPERLAIPLGWKKPQRVFVNSMSDLFHEAVPDSFIWEVFAVMAIARPHTFQVLTKRPERMRSLLADMYFWAKVEGTAQVRLDDAGYSSVENFAVHGPLPNIWLGVSAENQEAADERIPLLLQTPAAVRFVSAEPLLGPIDFSRWLMPTMMVSRGTSAPADPAAFGQALAEIGRAVGAHYGEQYLDWIIAGGESGPGHRPFSLDWARSIRDQCQAAGVAYFFKQVGGNTPKAGGRLLDGRTWDQFPEASHV